MFHYAVAHDYIETFSMNIIEGRDFSANIASDTMNFILNESAVRATGLDSPIGKEFYLLFRTGEIIGVVKDFHTFSVHSEIGPVILRMMPSEHWNYIFVRLNPENPNVPATLKTLEQTWNKFVPGFPFEYEFLDETLKQWYEGEKQMGTIFNYFTGLAIVICCLGLFGLVSFMTEKRTKEIGIRKVLGATVPEIVGLLSKEFIVLVIIANIIACPIAYYAMSKWLQNFAYHVNIGVAVFILTTAMALVIALLTVSYQAIKAATANPVNSLRYE